MPTNSHKLQINWSIWDGNPIVSWTCDGNLVSITFGLPPVAVTHLNSCERIAVVGNFDEFGSANLLLYSYDGVLQRTITAPKLGQSPQFGGVSENIDAVEAIVGFKDDTGWKEEAGRLNVNDGTIINLHRSY